MCLDLCKEFSDDSSFTEEHVLFLLNKYRALVLKQEYERQKKESSIENKQSICLDLEAVTDNIDSPCSDFMLRSVQKIPTTLEFSQPQISTINFFSNPMMVYVTPEKLKFVNYNKFLQNIIYCALAPDGCDLEVSIKLTQFSTILPSPNPLKDQIVQAVCAILLFFNG